MSEQQELQASRWIQNQPGLKIEIGNNGTVVITNGVTVYAEEIGFVRSVAKTREILKTMNTKIKTCFE